MVAGTIVFYIFENSTVFPEKMIKKGIDCIFTHLIMLSQVLYCDIKRIGFSNNSNLISSFSDLYCLSTQKKIPYGVTTHTGTGSHPYQHPVQFLWIAILPGYFEQALLVTEVLSCILFRLNCCPMIILYQHATYFFL